MFKKPLVSVSVTALAASAAATPMDVSTADALDSSLQFAKCNTCAGKKSCNPCAGKKK